jgi:hypothetical protein
MVQPALEGVRRSGDNFSTRTLACARIREDFSLAKFSLQSRAQLAAREVAEKKNFTHFSRGQLTVQLARLKSTPAVQSTAAADDPPPGLLDRACCRAGRRGRAFFRPRAKFSLELSALGLRAARRSKGCLRK